MSLKLATRTLAREEKNGLQYVRVRMTKKEEKEKKEFVAFWEKFDQTYFDFQQQSPTTITTTICSFNNQYFTNFYFTPHTQQQFILLIDYFLFSLPSCIYLNICIFSF